MTQKAQWDKVKHFKSWEFDDPSHPGSGELMHFKVVYALDHVRDYFKCKIHVLAAVDVDGTHGHADNSYHLARTGCKAVDFWVETDMSPRLQYQALERAEFGGIGIYYCWGIPIGFHVDTRPHEWLQRWVSRMKGQYDYLLGR